MRKLILTLTLATLTAPAALAQSDMSGHDMTTGDHTMGDHATMAEGIHAEATLNSLSEGMANVSHGPIPDIGWPAMTMDMTLLEGAEVAGVEPGDEVMMMIEKGPDGMYAIRALMPKE
ncbi:copper-binding protein [Roseovarius sp. D22-M7]|uniref:copper-binding protein n=1 Tax=Roseovarius sp. D22-M7 TaxID=3127116 RepID=UPI00300FF692